MNTLKTLILLGVLTAIMVAVGGVIGGRSGMMIAFVFSLFMNVGSYWFSAPMALAMSRAQPVSKEEAPELYDIVERIAANAKLPVPTVHIIPTSACNAFATGRDPEHSAVAVTQGILQVLNWQEMEAVLSHEMGHVRNRDILITSIASVLASVITMVAHFGFNPFFYGRDDEERGVNPIFVILLAVLAPFAAMLVQMAISRSREYEADATGAHLCGHPMALASALEKIEQISYQAPLNVNPALSSLYIIKPNPQSMFVNLCSTHPPTADRIRRLEEISREMHAQ